MDDFLDAEFSNSELRSLLSEVSAFRILLSICRRSTKEEMDQFKAFAEADWLDMDEE